MTTTATRHKAFGPGIRKFISRDDRLALIRRAEALTKQDDPITGTRKLSRTAFAIFKELLLGFYNLNTARCDPSYETIAAKAHCAVASVNPAIDALEALGLLHWCNRLIRIKQWVKCELLGTPILKTFIVRTSNAYYFPKPEKRETPPKAKNQSETTTQGLKEPSPKPLPLIDVALRTGIERFRRAFEGRMAKPPDKPSG